MSGPATILLDRAGGREFRLIRRLGEGGFGEVFLARLKSPGGLDQRVAVKLLLPDPDEKNQALARLRHEADVLSRLHHPVILAAHDLVEIGNRVALVTEYVDGQDLGQCITDPADPIPLGPMIEVVGQVAGALDAAWTQEAIVHRDVKPANIRVGRHGNVKLLDFGIAKSVGAAIRTQKNVVMGSLHYLAPERFELDRPPHPGSDVFALGCVFYERMRGARLFHKLDVAQLFALSRDPAAYERFLAQRIEAIDMTLPMQTMSSGRTVRDLLWRLLVRDPDARIPAGALAHECDVLARDLTLDETLRAWCRRRRWPSEPAEGTGLPLRELSAGSEEEDDDAPLRAPTNRAAASAPPPAPSEAVARLRADIPTLIRSGPLELDSAPHDPPPIDAGPGRARPLAWLGAMASLAAAALLVALVVLVGVGTVWFVVTVSARTPPPPRDLADPTEPAPDLAPDLPPAPVPRAEPPPVPPPEPAPEPAVEPAPDAPPPVSVPPERPRAARPVPRGEGVVKVVGAVRVELRGDTGAVPPSDHVPAGAWVAHADFGHGWVAVGSLAVEPGRTTYVECHSIREQCTISGP